MSCYFWPILTPPVTLCLTACHKIPVMSEMTMFNALDRLRPTAEGHDGLPAWYLRLLTPICSRSLTHLVNLSVLQSDCLWARDSSGTGAPDSADHCSKPKT